jgi:hypothetical protein
LLAAAVLCLLAVVGAACDGQEPGADVIAVSVTGDPGQYTFTVTVESPDTGCAQYADWWEVVSAGGDLIYRRVLLHSHVGEQPFARAGGPVEIEADADMIVRAHLHPAGYGGVALRGSVRDGWSAADLPADFAAQLAESEPQPPACAG